jgi:hypothetical protein
MKQTLSPYRKRLAPSQREPTPDPAFESIAGLVASVRVLQQQAAAAYTPIVQGIIDRRSQDVNEIEHTLDHLLDCACIPEGLALFKALCRYYYDIDPAATAAHVYAYREWYDADSIEPAKPAKRKKPAKANLRGLGYSKEVSA